MKHVSQRRQAVRRILNLAAFSALPASGLMGLAGCATNTAPATSLPQDEGRFVNHDNFISRFAPVRRVVVFLPPGYDRDALKNTRYPVLYMHDGQNLFDPKTSTHGQPWAVDKKISALARGGKIRPPIVVGIDNTAFRSRE